MLIDLEKHTGCKMQFKFHFNIIFKTAWATEEIINSKGDKKKTQLQYIQTMISLTSGV